MQPCSTATYYNALPPPQCNSQKNSHLRMADPAAPWTRKVGKSEEEENYSYDKPQTCVEWAKIYILTSMLVWCQEDMHDTRWLWCLLPLALLLAMVIVYTNFSPVLPPRTPDIIAHWQVAPPARPPSRWLPHIILTEPCCSFPDIPNMGWHNKKIFWYNINNTNIHA